MISLRRSLPRVVLAGLCAVGCRFHPASAGDATTTPSAYRVAPLDEKAVGWIVGRCRIGPVAPRWSITIATRCGKDDVVPREIPTERMIAAGDGGLAGCVVSLRAIAEGKDWPTAMREESRELALAVGDRRCLPHVSVARGGTQVSVSNRGPCDENVHGFFQTGTKFNFAVSPGRTVEGNDAYLETCGIYAVRSDCCASMSGFIHVMQHPYFAITSDVASDDRPSGAYSIDRVPPGEYELVCWHEAMDETPELRDGRVTAYRYGPDVVITKRVTVRAGETIAADFDVPAPIRPDTAPK